MDQNNTPIPEEPVGRVIDVNLTDEMEQSFLDYSMSVIVQRALPDVRDGLKPVHRRILYTMYENTLWPEKAYRKCADTVGSVLGRYHPHGDASVYDAMVRLAQDFSMRYMLVDGHGNFGSIDGDPPAAYRYTEARMNKLSVEMLKDIDKDTVDFNPNYDDRLKEPAVLPSHFPNILVNGSTGIAVGMATNIPPHNMGEVIDGMCALIDNPEATLEEVVEAAKAAHAHSFIKRLPQGYDTVIGEDGGSISQGQKQLLCIARVMLCLPPMLILDEATSSIDTRTEIRIQKAFQKMMEGRTSFIVAHRLSTIRDADTILVMRDGHIVEQGNHESLLQKGGFYAELYNSQFDHD